MENNLCQVKTLLTNQSIHLKNCTVNFEYNKQREIKCTDRYASTVRPQTQEIENKLPKFMYNRKFNFKKLECIPKGSLKPPQHMFSTFQRHSPAQEQHTTVRNASRKVSVHNFVYSQSNFKGIPSSKEQHITVGIYPKKELYILNIILQYAICSSHSA